jgi:hypothetical protein
MIVDDEFRESLGDRRFTLPDAHPAHRRMREILMTPDQITEFASFDQENNQTQITWDHHLLESESLVTSLPPRGPISKSGNRPSWVIFGFEEEHPEQYFSDYQFDVDVLLRDRPPLKAALNQDGTEALAWYIPFTGRDDNWGIYIRDVGPQIIANMCFPDLLRSDPTEAENLATDFLFQHEYFHHLSEIACTTLDNSRLHKPLFLPYFERLVSGDPEEVLEEALANSYALDYIPGGLKKAVRAFMDTCPPGYRDYHKYTNPSDWETGLDWLATMFTGQQMQTAPRKYMLGHGLFHHSNYSIHNKMKVPLHWTKDRVPCAPALPFKHFETIFITDTAKKLLRKIKNPILKKKFHSKINNLETQGILRHDRNLIQLNKKNWWKYNLGKSGDAHGNPRIIFQEHPAHQWSVEWFGKHTDYDKYRSNHGL